jgi:hypothetical protein
LKACTYVIKLFRGDLPQNLLKFQRGYHHTRADDVGFPESDVGDSCRRIKGHEWELCLEIRYEVLKPFILAPVDDRDVLDLGSNAEDETL